METQRIGSGRVAMVVLGMWLMLWMASPVQADEARYRLDVADASVLSLMLWLSEHAELGFVLGDAEIGQRRVQIVGGRSVSMAEAKAMIMAALSMQGLLVEERGDVWLVRAAP